MFRKAINDLMAAPRSPSDESKPFGTSTGEAVRRLQMISQRIQSFSKIDLQKLFSSFHTYYSKPTPKEMLMQWVKNYYKILNAFSIVNELK